jgi:hypothetical protein
MLIIKYEQGILNVKLYRKRTMERSISNNKNIQFWREGSYTGIGFHGRVNLKAGSLI